MKQKEALNILKSGVNVFLTGCAGSGKTYVLNEFIRYLRKKRIYVGITASTGIAATHLSGVTIHSFTGMGVLDDLTQRDLNDILKRNYLEDRITKAEVLIIDEISMLSAEQLDIADVIIRKFRKSNAPFGGMQVVMCGDFFQLPPVKRRSGLYSEGVSFAYKSRAWAESDPRICYLTEQHRHKEDGLVSVLSKIRDGCVDEDALNLLRNQYKAKIEGSDKITKLYTHNANVDSVNRKHLGEIRESKKTYRLRKKGNKNVANTLADNILAPRELELKKGATVMFVKNNFEEGYVNGSLGMVVDFKEGFPVVRKSDDGRKICVAPERWVVEDNYSKVAEVEQVPLRLAWAITVHKSQGATIDAVEVDLSRAFEPGMGYVALSRAKSLKNMRVMGLNKVALTVNENVVEMDNQFRNLSEKEQR